MDARQQPPLAPLGFRAGGGDCSPALNWPRSTKPSLSSAPSALSIASRGSASACASALALVGPAACSRPRSSSRTACAGSQWRFAYSAGTGSAGDATLRRIQHREHRQLLGRDPEATLRCGELAGAAGAHQLRERCTHSAAGAAPGARDRVHHTEQHQRIVQLIGALGCRPGLAAHLLDRRRHRAAELRRALRIDPAPRGHRLGAPLLERCVVQIGIGPGARGSPAASGEGCGRSRVITCTSPCSIARSSATSPSTSIASCRQSCSVWRTSG